MYETGRVDARLHRVLVVVKREQLLGPSPLLLGADGPAGKRGGDAVEIAVQVVRAFRQRRQAGPALPVKVPGNGLEVFPGRRRRELAALGLLKRLLMLWVGEQVGPVEAERRLSQQRQGVGGAVP